MTTAPAPRLVPELYVSDIARSLSFYRDVLGFEILYDRPEQRFACLSGHGATVMLEQPTDPERTWLAGSLEQPYGRGVSFQIEVDDIKRLYREVLAAEASVFLPIEDRSYRVGDSECGNRQFIVQDPDGYLMRMFQSLGRRDLPGI